MLISCSNGDPQAREEMLPLVYEELRRLARWYLHETVNDPPFGRSANVVHTRSGGRILDCQRSQ